MKRVITFYMCFAMCIVLFAQATDLTIDIQTPGWLSSKIDYADQQTVKNLKVTGYINNGDLAFIGKLTQLSLKVIDLSDVTIVGDFWDGNFKHAASSLISASEIYYKDYTYNLQKLVLPHNLSSYLENGCISHSTIDTLVFDTKVNKIGNCELLVTGYKTERTFYRKIGHLILGENVDSLMYLDVDCSTVHLPKSLKYIAPIACVGHEDLSQWNIREFPNLETIDSHAFTYRRADYKGTETISNSATLPDSLFFPNIKQFVVNSFDYKEGMHVFLGEKLELFGGCSDGYDSPCNNVSFHFKAMSPPREMYSTRCVSCKVYVPKGTKEAYQSAFNKTQYTVIEEAQPLEDIALDKESILMEVGDKATLTATPVPENADDINMIWSVDKPEVISVTEEGEIEALTSGTAVITITSTDGKIEKKCTVCVKTHATDVVIEPSDVIFTKLGEMVQLQAVVLPEETYDKSVKWTSSNPSVCTVTASGKLVAVGYGEAVVMAVTNDGNLPAVCVVTVKKPAPKYHLVYVVDGEVYASYELEEGSLISPIEIPAKEGYTFSGWSEIPATMPANDVTIIGTYIKIPKCATPIIASFIDGKLIVECATEGAQCVTNITAVNPDTFYDNEIDVIGAFNVFNVRVYATAEGYEDSDVVTTVLKLPKAVKGDLNSDGYVNISDVTTLVNIILGK